ncbi:hypothetical protein [Lautropia mirabilis]|uniref:hypothetical protein n=1 Tax=Lautropia mirabilis TaxID=47671 RepID=UPI0028ED6509|nr:hypothetical protein [Lautropia mirabilis]
MRQIDFHVERKLVKGVLTSEQKKISSQLKPLFTEHTTAEHGQAGGPVHALGRAAQWRLRPGRAVWLD